MVDRREYHRQWREKNKDKIAEYQKKYWDKVANKEQVVLVCVDEVRQAFEKYGVNKLTRSPSGELVPYLYEEREENDHANK